MSIIIDENVADYNFCKSINPCNDPQEIEKFRKFYNLYEYSDEINIITDNPQYPSIINYVKTGLLTEEEIIQAILYN